MTVDEKVIPDKINPEEVLVSVKFAGLNYMDLLIQRGWFKRFFFPIFPYVFGTEASGVVVGVGCNCSNLKIGDHVLGSNSNGGTCAKYVIYKESELARKPSNMSFEVAASIPTSGMMAYDVLFKTAKLKEGQKVLILGASGAVGSNLVQMARSVGAEIYCTTSSENAKYVKTLGADHVIDYTSQKYEDYIIDELDVVVDCTSDLDTRIRATGILKNNGKFIQVGIKEEIGYKMLFKMGSSIIGNYFKRIFGHPSFHIATLGNNPETLNKVIQLYASGTIQPTITKIYKFEEYKLAYSLLESKRSVGKILLKIE
jgi:NADPH:quinone reductase-like Zn-dependent oxidoreductase